MEPTRKPETGATLHEMAAKPDAGAIIAQKLYEAGVIASEPANPTTEPVCKANLRPKFRAR